MLLEVLERPDGGMASHTLLADLRELSERAHAELDERLRAREQQPGCKPTDPGYAGRVDAREERLAQNEILFREVNERIEQTASPLGTDWHLYEFLCECSNIDCTLRLPMTMAVYEEVRSDPACFIVAPGHELPEIEEVLSRTSAYQIVKKEGDAARLVAREDPRS